MVERRGSAIAEPVEKCLRTIDALWVLQEDIEAFGFEIPVRTAMQKTIEFMTTKLDSYNSENEVGMAKYPRFCSGEFEYQLLGTMIL